MGRVPKIAVSRAATMAPRGVHPLKQFRINRGYSASSLGRAAGLHGNTIRKIEDGNGCHIDTAVQLIEYIHEKYGPGELNYRDLRYNPL